MCEMHGERLRCEQLDDGIIYGTRQQPPNSLEKRRSDVHSEHDHVTVFRDTRLKIVLML